MMGIRHGRAWIYILLSWDHQCEPGSLCPPYSPTPLYLESFPNLKKKKKGRGCLSGWAPPKLLQTFAYRWCYLSSPQVTTSSGWCLNVTPTWGIGRG